MNQLTIERLAKPTKTRALENYKTQYSKESQNKKNIPMYAIAFDLKVSDLEIHYGKPYNNAYGDIKKFLISKGFSNQQGSVYFGDAELVDAVKCVMAVSELSQKYPWFKDCVTDIRMLRIEDNNDLTPAL
jgi:virulence-associated protein VapD